MGRYGAGRDADPHGRNPRKSQTCGDGLSPAVTGFIEPVEVAEQRMLRPYHPLAFLHLMSVPATVRSYAFERREGGDP